MYHTSDPDQVKTRDCTGRKLPVQVNAGRPRLHRAAQSVWSERIMSRRTAGVGCLCRRAKRLEKWFGRWCRVIVTGVVLVWMDRKHWYGTRAAVIHLAGLDLIRAEWALTHATRLW